MSGAWKVIVTAVFLSGCLVRPIATGPVEYDSRSIERDKSEQVRVRLTMGAGDLKVGGGTSKLAQAYFTYNVPDWKPRLDYTSGELTIEQPGSHHTHFGSQKYEWDVRLGQDIPLDFSLRFGAGQAQLDLGSLALRDVQIQMGVGQLDLDLRGNPRHDYSVRIQGGVGQATVRLPADAGVSATASGGIGEIKTRGLRKQGGQWVNEAYAMAPVKVRVDVQGGIGQITLIGDAP
jgi:hypothetical protein